jgi:hypothetical protein
MEDKRYSVDELIALCKTNRITKLKVGPIEMEFDPEALRPESKEDPNAEKILMAPTGDEMLYWSVPDTMFDQPAAPAEA